jgi:hypothetical protein
MLTFVPHFFYICDVLLTKVSEKKPFWQLAKRKNMIEMI